MAWTRYHPVGDLAEEVPSHLGQQVGLAISASQQEQQGLVGQFFHRRLPRPRDDLIWLARVLHECIRG